MQYAYMNIHVHIEDHMVELVGIDDTSSPHGGHVKGPNFKIMGTRLGITTLYVSSLLINTNILCPQLSSIVRFSVGNLGWRKFKDKTWYQVSASQQSGHEILSQPIKVEVYAPPRIHPPNIFLAPGASYVVCSGYKYLLVYSLFSS